MMHTQGTQLHPVLRVVQHNREAR